MTFSSQAELATIRPIPGYALGHGVDPVVLTDEYEHWTVADMIDMLKGYPQDARMWIAATDSDPDDDPIRLHPIELIGGSDGEVILW